MKLLDQVLLDNNAPRHTVILSLYTLNLLQIQIDNTLRPQCPTLEPLLGFKCDDLEKLVAAIFTMGETDAVNRLVAEVRKYGLRINLVDYNLTGNAYLGAKGDLDRDGFTNLEEYNAVCKRMDPYIEAAISRGLTPNTVPCCGDCPS
ncbi:MAG: hypothetical protein HC888_15030 [Candidatus Competibacteraceae bacterium]|nr:hypothetical protein [Candidatus Competibacteraceae bacterium]